MKSTLSFLFTLLALFTAALIAAPKSRRTAHSGQSGMDKAGINPAKNANV
ncbi:hypothetical protein [Hahella sp. CCB-MM4]|nr:hypothetical protein [Hahella sp. CCB-MM4]